MKVLGIDTSTSCASIGLADENSAISDYLLDIPVTHSERLLDSIEYVLKGASVSIEDLEGWAISLGPGSFTGLRIGVSTMKGLAFATRRPVAGIATLDVVAFNVSPTPHLICPMLDARKGEVYTAFYRYDNAFLLKRLSAYQVFSPKDLRQKISEKTIFLGSGVKTYRSYLEDSLKGLALFVPDPLNSPHGATVARLGIERIQKNQVVDLSTFTPIYVRASEAEIKWKEKHPE